MTEPSHVRLVGLDACGQRIEEIVPWEFSHEWGGYGASGIKVVKIEEVWKDDGKNHQV